MVSGSYIYNYVNVIYLKESILITTMRILLRLLLVMIHVQVLILQAPELSHLHHHHLAHQLLHKLVNNSCYENVTFIIFIILVEIAVPESMSDEFASIQTSFGRMLYNVRKIIKKEPPPLDDIKEFLCCYKSSLKSHLSSCSDISEVLQVIEKECSLINIRLLQSAVEEFRFKEAEKFINEYKDILKKFCHSVSLTLCLNEKFASGGTPLLQCEMATYVFDWEPDEHTLKDIRRIISKSSGKLVQIKFIKRGNSIIVTCSFPYSLTGSLVIKVMENLDILIKNGLMKLTIGYCTVWNKQVFQCAYTSSFSSLL